jgi:hypothetical protein
LAVNCDGTPPTIQLEWGGRPYEVINISYTNTTQSTTRIKDPLLLDYLNTQKCESLTNLTFPSSPSISYEITSPNQTLFKCNRTLPITSPTNFKNMSCHETIISTIVIQTIVLRLLFLNVQLFSSHKRASR